MGSLNGNHSIIEIIWGGINPLRKFKLHQFLGVVADIPIKGGFRWGRGMRRKRARGGKGEWGWEGKEGRGRRRR
jgi:hypothetical protein